MLVSFLMMTDIFFLPYWSVGREVVKVGFKPTATVDGRLDSVCHTAPVVIAEDR